MSRHVTPDFRQVGFAGTRFVGELAAEEYRDSIREFEQFIEVLAHQQNGCAAIARRHDLGTDLRHCREVRPKQGLVAIIIRLRHQARAPARRAGRCPLRVRQ